MTVFILAYPSVFWESGLVAPTINNYTFNGILKGKTYNVTVVAVNGVGNSSSAAYTTISKLLHIKIYKLCNYIFIQFWLSA